MDITASFSKDPAVDSDDFVIGKHVFEDSSGAVTVGAKQ